MDFSQKCNDFCGKSGILYLAGTAGAATTSPHMIPPHTKALADSSFRRTPPVYRKRRRGFLLFRCAWGDLTLCRKHREHLPFGVHLCAQPLPAASARRTACRACVPCTGSGDCCADQLLPRRENRSAGRPQRLFYPFRKRQAARRRCGSSLFPPVRRGVPATASTGRSSAVVFVHPCAAQ